MAFYTCPMHPEIKREKPGICSECGMNLVLSKGHDKSFDAAQDKHAGHSTQMFLKKFWVSLALTIPVVFYSDILKTLFGFEAPVFPGSRYVPFVFGSVVFFYGGSIFLKSAWRELRARLPGMMTLIAIAIFAAYAWSVFTVVAGEAGALFWELTTLITVMLLGHWMEMRAVSSAQGALKELSKLLPDTAEVIRGRKTKTIPLAELKVGDLVFVRPGGRIPADGVVVEGTSETNEAMITGESAPVPKRMKSEVIAGTINGDGSLKVKVTKVGEHTFLAGVMRLVEEAQASKSRLQVLSDKAAFYLTLIAVLGGGLTFILWLVAKAGFGFAVERLVAVLVIACPHALGLAVPLVAAISTTLAARNGFLVRQRLALELARKIDVVLFDKTGTLTSGEFSVTEATDDVLRLAAAVDTHSEHPIARAIVAEAAKRGLQFEPARDFERLPGVGGRGAVGGRKVFVGHKGASDIVVEVDGKQVGTIAVADTIREESYEAATALKGLGLRVAMISGDSEEEARRVAEELGIKEYFSRVLPGEKVEKVRILQRDGAKVAMIGDGINDAPALVQADLGIAIGAGTNVAIESAGIILVRNDPRDIVKIIKLSRATFSKMLQNLFWATGYNVVALPLAAGALYSQGILLEPALAALFMSLSTVIVAVNALLLRRRSL